jgi:hypothetical protein
VQPTTALANKNMRTPTLSPPRRYDVSLLFLMSLIPDIPLYTHTSVPLSTTVSISMVDDHISMLAWKAEPVCSMQTYESVHPHISAMTNTIVDGVFSKLCSKNNMCTQNWDYCCFNNGNGK